MHLRPATRLVAGLLFAVAGAMAGAAERPFDQKTFDDLRASGRPVVLHVYAVWCGTCKVQASIVTPLLSQPEFASLTVLRADFDQEKALLRAFGIADRSTFLAFRHGKEVARSVADMNKENIANLMRKALE
jgi:thiol-disulfide isomerase/thioredoxin